MAALREAKPDVPVEHGKLVRLPGTIGRFQFVCTPRCRPRRLDTQPMTPHRRPGPSSAIRLAASWAAKGSSPARTSPAVPCRRSFGYLYIAATRANPPASAEAGV